MSGVKCVFGNWYFHFYSASKCTCASRVIVSEVILCRGENCCRTLSLCYALDIDYSLEFIATHVCARTQTFIVSPRTRGSTLDPADK